MAEDAYLDALEALTEGNRERAIELATALVKAEPDHASAWALLSDAYIPGDQKAVSYTHLSLPTTFGV